MKKLALLSVLCLLVGCANTPIGDSLSRAIAPQQLAPVVTLPPGFPLPVYPPGRLTVASGNEEEGRLVFNVSNGTEALQFYQKFFTQQEWDNLSQTPQQIVAFNRRYLVTVTNQEQTLSLYYLKLQTPIAPPTAPPVSPPPTTPPPAPTNPPNPYLADLQKLGVIPSDLNMNATISRREYARWLVTTHNRFFSDPTQQIRLTPPIGNCQFSLMSPKVTPILALFKVWLMQALSIAIPANFNPIAPSPAKCCYSGKCS